MQIVSPKVEYADFSLNENFLQTYRDRDPGWTGLDQIVFLRTYSREKESGEMETWFDTCYRVIRGMYGIQKWRCQTNGLPWDEIKAQNSAEEAFDLMYRKVWLPPGRGLAHMGADSVLKIGGSVLTNCAFISTQDMNLDFAFPFTWTLMMLAHGCGVGFDTRGAGKVEISSPVTSENYIVQDSREGWCDYVEALLMAYTGTGCPLPSPDYSLVRPKGAKIKGLGGTASGAGALVTLTEKFRKILDSYDEKRLDSVGITLLMNVIGECIVSGGSRRSSEIAFSDVQDGEFLSMKNFSGSDRARELAADGMPTWASNNSVFVNGDEDLSTVVKNTQANGEPGYVFINNFRSYGRMKDGVNWVDAQVMGTNPCGEQGLFHGEVCTLAETVPVNAVDIEEYLRAVKYAYLYAKTVTLIPTWSPITNQVIWRNRRIGLGQTGVLDNIERVGMATHFKWCDEGYKAVEEWDDAYSNWLGIPKSIKKTTVKPSGTISLLANVRSGVHDALGTHIMRTVRIHDTSPLIPRLIEAGYKVEDAINESNTKVVYFPLKYENRKREGSRTMWEQLSLVANMQHYWSDNAVSCTIDFDPEKEGPDIGVAIDAFRHRVKSISFLPRNNHGYQQAPITPIGEGTYEAYSRTLSPVNFDGIYTHESDDKFCDGGMCTIG